MAEHNRVAEIYSLLIPLTEGRLIVPRACVAEVIGFQAPSELPGAPQWLLGTLPWGGKAVPVISFERTCGQRMLPPSARNRVIVLHCLGTELDGGNFALLAQGFPQLVRVSSDVVGPDRSHTFPDDSPILCQVRMTNDSPLVPDLERLEEMIAQQMRILE